MSSETIFDSKPVASCVASERKPSVEIIRPKLCDAFRNLITREEAEDLVKNSVSKDAELVDYHLRAYSEEKLGFLGSHLCLIVITRRPGEDENELQSYFVKTMPYDVPTQAAYIQEKGCFRKETEFFRLMVPLLMKNFQGDDWAPKCYLAKEHVMVFEDLKTNGFSNRSRSLDECSVEAALACIARFHACSLLAEEQIDGKSLKDTFPDLLKESEFKREGRSYTWFSVAIDLAVAIASELGLDTINIRRASDCVFDIGEPSETKRNVVSHGDLWSSNMMFAEENRCKLVDFQLLRYAPLAHDVMQLLYLSTSRDFRRKHERRMIERYYKVLTDTLKMNDFKGEVPTFMELLQGAEEQRLAALVTAVIFHPTVLMDGKTAAKIMNDPLTYESYYFNDRKPFVREIMSNNPEYEKKIKDNVKELVDMSLIVDSLPSPM